MAKPSEHFNEQVILESEGSRRVQLVADARGIFFDGVVKALTIDFKRVQLDPTAPGRVLIQTNEALFTFVMLKPGHATRLVDVLRIPPWMLRVTPRDESAADVIAPAAKLSPSTVALWAAVGVATMIATIGGVVSVVANGRDESPEAEARRAIAEATAQVAEAVANIPSVVEANAESTTEPSTSPYTVTLVEDSVGIRGGLAASPPSATLRNTAAFERCLATGRLGRTPTFLLRLDVRVDGAISTASVQDAGTFGNCISQAARGWLFPPRATRSFITATYQVTPVP